MKEEDELKRICGTQNPFTLPDGYFEDFTRRLMEQLPTENTHAAKRSQTVTWRRIAPWISTAAVFCGLLFGAHAYLQQSESAYAVSLLDDETSSSYSDEYIEAIIDNSMMDDYTIYCYLTESENDID